MIVDRFMSLSLTQLALVTPVVAAVVSLGLVAGMYIEAEWRYGSIHKWPFKKRSFLRGHTQYFSSDPRKSRDLHEEIANEYNEPGLTEFWFGPIPCIQFADPELAKIVLASNTLTKKSVMNDTLRGWIGDGLVLSEGIKWKTRRHMLTPVFHFEILKSFAEVMDRQGDILIECLKQASDKDQAFDISSYVTRCSLDIICETALGYQLNGQQSPNESDYIKNTNVITFLLLQRMRNPLMLNDTIYSLTPSGRKFHAAVKEVRSFTEGIIESRKNNPTTIADGKRLALLDLLLTAKDELTGEPLTVEAIREEVDTFTFAGHDTSSGAISWCIYEIARHPEIQRKLQEEVDEVMDTVDDHLALDDLSKFKYLEMVIKETLRLYPIAPIIARELTEDIEVDGTVIKSGITAAILIWAIHLNPRYWPNPTVFDPDRWTHDKMQARHPYAFIPFSAGPRNCIGSRFAMSEIKTLTAKIVRNFQIELVSEVDVAPVQAIVLRPDPGVFVKLTPRR